MTAHTALHEALNRATAHSRPGHAHQNLASALSISYARLMRLLVSGMNLEPRVEAAARRYLAPSTFKPPTRKPRVRGDVGAQGCRWAKQPGELRHGDRRRYGWHKDDGDTGTLG